MGQPGIVEGLRGGLVEQQHSVLVAICRADGSLVASAGDHGHVTYVRSAAKPFQALPAVRDGVDTAYGIDARGLAIACASHEGTPWHVEAVSAVLRAAGIPASALRPRGLHPPLGDAAARELARSGRAYGAYEHNCSGNHALMLAHAHAAGWPLERYLDPEAPGQVAAREALTALAGEGPHVAGDRCGMPTYGLPLTAVATAYARLAAGAPGVWAEPGRRVSEAMREHPELVGGDEASDTLAMRTHPGLIAKRGALGVFCCASTETGLGGALKVVDGSDAAADDAAPALAAAVAGELAALGTVLERPLLDGDGQPVGLVRTRLVVA